VVLGSILAISEVGASMRFQNTRFWSRFHRVGIGRSRRWRTFSMRNIWRIRWGRRS